MEHILDEATRPWGVSVERVEIKDVRVPVQLQRAMAAEAEAAREARAKVVAAEGEQKASSHLKEAALVLEESSSALQLRYLQTLSAISTEQSSTIVFPFPIDSLSLGSIGNKKGTKKEVWEDRRPLLTFHSRLWSRSREPLCYYIQVKILMGHRPYWLSYQLPSQQVVKREGNSS